MLYLLDANVLITAHNTYYPVNRIPEFWSWLEHQGELGLVKIPLEIFEEIIAGGKGGDLLLGWIDNDKRREVLLLDEAVDPDLVRLVVKKGYADNLTDDEVEKLGRDPFLISYALAGPDRCLVTTENSKPTKTRHNKKIPDVCVALKIQWCSPFRLYHDEGFTTDWQP